MEIQYFGANCLRIVTPKKVRIVIDDNLNQLGGKSVQSDQDIALYTGSVENALPALFRIECPGEYEISEVSVVGVPAKRHIDETGTAATMYSIHINELNVVILGHIDENLTDAQLERLGVVDVLCIPVGNHGYTLDGIAAAALTKKIEPKIVIPTHYDDPSLKYEVPQSPVDDFLKAMGAAEAEPIAQLKVKESELGEKTSVVILQKQ